MDGFRCFIVVAVMTVFACVQAFTQDEPAAPAAEAKPAQEAAPAAPAAVEEDLPEPRPINMVGVVLINPENKEEAVLLIQMSVPGPDGAPTSQMIGVPLVKDEQSQKLIAEFGVVASANEDPEAAKKVQEEAMKKVVKVEGILSFTQDGPQLKINTYEKLKMDAGVGLPEASEAPKAAEPVE